MYEAEKLLLEKGQHPRAVERDMAERWGVSSRTARRYVLAVRKIYARQADADRLTVAEMLALLLARSQQALDGGAEGGPDHKASIKALEVYARMCGWLDRRTFLTVDGQVTHTHAIDTAALSTEEMAALRAFHDAAERARLVGPGVVESTATIDGDVSQAQAQSSTTDAITTPAALTTR